MPKRRVCDSSGDTTNLLRRARDEGKVVKRNKKRKSGKNSLLTYLTTERASSAGYSEDSSCDSPSQSRSSSPPPPPPHEETYDDHVTSPGSSRDRDLVALDCEMVATRDGSSLAQCSIVSYEGETLFHDYVRPPQPIIDYRTRWSGVMPRHMKKARPHATAVAEIRRILAGKTLIGHDLTHDFSVIGVTPPKHKIRDTARFTPLRTLAGLSLKHNPSLKNLSLKLLGRKIQNGFHNSLEDARAALDLYRKHEGIWERYLVEQNWDRTVWLQDQYWPSDI